MSEKEKNKPATDEVAELKKENEALRKENEALKVVNAAGEDPAEVPQPVKFSDQEREFKVDKKKYRFIDVPAIWASGKKVSMEDAVKDEKLQATLAAAKSKYIKIL